MPAPVEQQLGMRDDSLHEPGLQGLLSIERLAGHHHELGHLAADDVRRTKHSVARHETECGLRHTERGAIGGEDDIARQRQLAAAAERQAVHGGDHRQRAVLQRGETFHRIDLIGTFAFQRRERGEARDVAAGTERFVASAGEHDGAGLLIRYELIENASQIAPELRGECVVLFDAVDGQQCDRAVVGDGELADASARGVLDGS